MPKPQKRFLSPELRAAIARERKANASTAAERERFRAHRERVMALLDAAPGGSLCVLGPGNCNDLELEQLATRFDEVHLLDLDERAVTGALGRLDAEQQRRFVVHAPLDVSGLVEKLPRYRAMQVTAEVLLRLPGEVASGVAKRVGRRFDCVLSSGLLTQLQLMVVAGLGDQHRLFGAVSQTQLLTHLRLMEALLAPNGVAWLITELAAVDPHGEPPDPALAWTELIRRGEGFSIAQPELLSSIVADDPVLQRAVTARIAEPVWYWQQGPERRYLTYALGLSRSGAG